MEVTLLGSGNTATVLGRRLVHAGHSVHQVYSRTMANAQVLADELKAEAIDDYKKINTTADLYMLCLADSALYSIEEQLRLPGKLVVHTAGSVPMKVLENISNNYGIVYPLQTLRKELPKPPALTILVDANNETNRNTLLDFARSFADQVEVASDEERSKLHLAAVIANNFSNYLFALAEEYCKKEKVDFQLLIPLLEETAGRLRYASPADVQTGPAIRNDKATMEKHLQMLNEYPRLREVYGWFSEKISLVSNEKFGRWQTADAR